MRILFLGDIVGSPGLSLIKRALPHVRGQHKLDAVIANAENVTGGSGLTSRSYRELRNAGIDLVTMGDHVYRRLEIVKTLENDDRICRPANFPSDAPGRNYVLAKFANGATIAAFCLLGRTFMRSVDCPFQAADRVLESIPKTVQGIFVDMHAEATADKYLMLHHLKGRVSAVFGTHTHIPTADEHVVPEGTAFICDVGMTGPHESILGRRIDRVLSTTVTFIPSSFDVAKGDVRMNGAIVELDTTNGQAKSIERFRFMDDELPT